MATAEHIHAAEPSQDDIDKLFSLASLPTPSPHDEQLMQPWAKRAVLGLQTRIQRMAREARDAAIAENAPELQAGNLRRRGK